jgi:hypothetical protein
MLPTLFDVLCAEACKNGLYAELNAALTAAGQPHLPFKIAAIEKNAAQPDIKPAAVAPWIEMDAFGEPVNPCRVAMESRGFMANVAVVDSERTRLTIEHISGSTRGLRPQWQEAQSFVRGVE